MPEITIRTDMGGFEIIVSAPLAKTLDDSEINRVIDFGMKAAGRARSKISLTEKLVDLRARQKSLDSLDDRRKERIETVLRDKAMKIEDMRRVHEASGGRAVVKLPAKFHAAYEQQIAEIGAMFDRERAEHHANIPIIEAQIARLRAVIAGRDPNEPLEEEIAEAGLNAASD